MKYLISMSKLKSLNLMQTNVTAAGIKDLMKALPQCKIEWDKGTRLRRRRQLIPTGKRRSECCPLVGVVVSFAIVEWRKNDASRLSSAVPVGWCSLFACGFRPVTTISGAGGRAKDLQEMARNPTHKVQMIPMRDGVKLHTIIYEPKETRTCCPSS